MTYSALNGPGMSQNKIGFNRWSKSPISNHVEEEHENAGEASPAPLGELWAIVPTEQQTERKHEGLHLQLPSTDLLLGREFWALHPGEPILQIKEATHSFYSLSLHFLVIPFFSVIQKWATRSQIDSFCCFQHFTDNKKQVSI